MIRWALILSVVTGLLAYVLVSTTDINEIIRAITRLDSGTWIAVLALSLVNYGLRFARWHTYLGSLGHRIPAIHHLAIYVSGFALTPTPGKVGEGLRAVYLRPYGVAIARTLSALYAERILDVVAVSFLAAFLFLAPVSGFRWLALLGGAVAVALLAAQHPAVLDFTQRLVALVPVPRLRALGERVAGFQRDVTALIRADLFALGLAAGLVAWAAEGFGLYLVADALGFELGLWAAVGIYAAGVLAGAFSFIPGGLGSAEATMVALLTLSGAPLSAAIAATVLVRVATLWFAVLLGAGAWLGLEATRRSLPSPAPVRVKREQP